MNSVAILACSNGFGHIKRAYILNKLLLDKGVDVQIFADQKKFNKYIDSKNFRKIKNIVNVPNLPSALDYKNYPELDLEQVFKKFSENIEPSTFLISDNYFEPFLYGCRGALLANFLWTDISSNVHTKDILKNLEDYSEVTILTSPFAREYLQNYQNTFKVNIFGKQATQLIDKGYIFICKGFGSWEDGFEENIEHFFSQNENFFLNHRIYYDKNIEALNLPSSLNYEKYNGKFTKDFIGHASCIVGRPSLGIVTDSLSAKIPFIPVFSNSDNESLYNEKILKSLYSKSKFYLDFNIFESRKAIKDIDVAMNGEKDAVNFICEHLSI